MALLDAKENTGTRNVVHTSYFYYLYFPNLKTGMKHKMTGREGCAKSILHYIMLLKGHE
jgi:hypothetical protein